MATQLPNNDQALRGFLVNFHDQCAGHLTTLGISSGQITALNAKILDLDTALTAVTAGRATFKGLVSAKDDAKQAALAEVRPLIRIIRGHDVPSQLLDELGIGTIDPHTPVQPAQPMLLTATPQADGVNWLRWKRGSNKPATTYMVEVQNANTEGWQLIAVVNRLNYRHENQEPGFQQTYRVRAVRRGIPGIASFQATVYGPEQQNAAEVQLKVA